MAHENGSEQLPKEIEERVRILVARSAWKGERIVSIARLVFCAAVFARTLVVVGGQRDDYASVRIVATAAAVLPAMALSVWFFKQRGRTIAPWLWVSVALDAVFCVFALSTNALWGAKDYAGILTIPDVDALLLITVAAGFRHSAWLSLFGGGLNALSFCGLLALDRALIAERITYSPASVVMFGILLAGFVTIAVATAHRSRTLATQSAWESLQLERAHGRLSMILDRSHDSRSLLSAASLRSGLLLRALRRDDSTLDREDPAAIQQARQLHDDLKALEHSVRGVREQSFTELLALREPAVVDVEEAIERALPKLRERFTGLRIEHKCARSRSLRAIVAGGQTGIERIVHNAVANSAEGDGERGASYVVIVTSERERVVMMVIEDDGPGFDEAHLASEPTSVPSKTDGSGIGLAVIRDLVAASDARITLENNAGGGARVIIAWQRS